MKREGEEGKNQLYFALLIESSLVDVVSQVMSTIDSAKHAQKKVKRSKLESEVQYDVRKASDFEMNG